MKKLYITLDGGKKLSLGSPETYDTKKFRLRTVDKNQYQARINIGLSDGDKNYVLRSVYLDKLKPSENGYSFLQCQLIKEGWHLILTIKNTGRTLCRERFLRIPGKILARNILLSLGVVLLFGGLTALLLLADFSGLTGQEREERTERTYAAEKPSPSIDEPVEREELSPANDSIAKSPVKEAETIEDVNKEKEKTADVTEVVSESEADETVETVTVTEADRASDGVEKEITAEPAGEGVTNTVEIKIEAPDFTMIDKNDLILHFTPNSSALNEESIESLENVVAFLLEYPSVHVSITGHCAIAGTEAGREEISVQRALNVETWLKNKGWRPEVPPSVKGEAGKFPLTMDPENQEINRRVEINLSGE